MYYYRLFLRNAGFAGALTGFAVAFKLLVPYAGFAGVPALGFAGVPAPPVFISGVPASPVLYMFFCFLYIGKNILVRR